MNKHSTSTGSGPERIIDKLIKVEAGSIAAGSITLPCREKEVIQNYIDTIISFAKAAGHEVPDCFIFSAGQVFYQNGYPDEIRLSGFVSGEESDTTEWTTPTPPKLWMGQDGVLAIHPADEGRTHLSALIIGNQQEVAFRWDLRACILETDGATPIPYAFLDRAGKLPNNPLIAAGLGAIWKGGPRARALLGGWSETETGHPIYQHAGSKGGRILIYPNPTRSAAYPLPAAEALWDFVESLNPFTSDVALAVLAQLCEPSLGDKPKYPLLESVRISSDAILHYKGIKRWGLEHQLLQERVFEEMERLRTLHFNVEKYPARNPKTGKWEPEGASWQGDRLFDIVKVEQYRKSPHGDQEQIEVSWLVRAGQWAYWWLNAQGRVWIARMARVLLELDHRENRGSAVLAKKIGQRITLLDGALQPGMLSPLRIDHMLESIGELPALDKRDKHWAGRTRDRFDEALLKLQEVGVFAKAEWPNGCGPDDPDRGKGWVDRWLAAHVKITLPEVPPELPAVEQKVLPVSWGTKKGGRPKKLVEEQKVDGNTIRRTRKERSLSQEELARYLGIDRTYLSRIESGKWLPPRELASKIQEWLEKDDD